VFSEWKERFRRWRSEARERQVAWEGAWEGQDSVGDGGLTPFQRSTLAALTSSVGDVALTCCGRREMYLRCDLPLSATFLFIYKDEVEVHGPRPWRAECYDYMTPADVMAACSKPSGPAEHLCPGAIPDVRPHCPLVAESGLRRPALRVCE
jgi:hypothetical protein